MVVLVLVLVLYLVDRAREAALGTPGQKFGGPIGGKATPNGRQAPPGGLQERILKATLLQYVSKMAPRRRQMPPKTALAPQVAPSRPSRTLKII